MPVARVSTRFADGPIGTPTLAVSAFQRHLHDVAEPNMRAIVQRELVEATRYATEVAVDSSSGGGAKRDIQYQLRSV